MEARIAMSYGLEQEVLQERCVHIHAWVIHAWVMSVTIAGISLRFRPTGLRVLCAVIVVVWLLLLQCQ